MNQVLLLYICTRSVESKACIDFRVEGFNYHYECLFPSTFGVFAWSISFEARIILLLVICSAS